MLTRSAVAICLLLPGAAAAQEPLSAIDWLSDTWATPVASTPQRREAPVAQGAAVESVTVRPLDAPSPDTIGLLPSRTTGLPRETWGTSDAGRLASLFAQLPLEQLPAAQRLTRTLLLAELSPPQSAQAGQLFEARVDALLARGALEEADALLTRAKAMSGTAPQATLFQRSFDVALLTGNEDAGCRTLRSAPGLSPSLPVRIFCLARTGDWPAAALTLQTARALGQVTERDEAILARFLDPELFEDEPSPTPAKPISPLMFRLFEAIGEPISTTSLPVAFGQADLRSNTGWKARLSAAERLARIGAIPADTLMAIYKERRPSASGGVWERASAIQSLDRALETGGPATGPALLEAWRRMQAEDLGAVFAKAYGPRTKELTLTGPAAGLAFQLRLFTEGYETAAQGIAPDRQEAQFLAGLAQGTPDPAIAQTDQTRAVAAAFADPPPALPPYLALKLKDGRLGEGILEALILLGTGARGDVEDMTQALSFFRAAGLEETARRAALEHLLLGPNG